MKKLRLIAMGLAAATVFAIAGCGSGGGPGTSARCSGFGADWADEAQALSEALSAYSQDASRENCLEYVDALEDYFDALKDWEKCARSLGVLSEWRSILNDAEDDLEDQRDDC